MRAIKNKRNQSLRLFPLFFAYRFLPVVSIHRFAKTLKFLFFTASHEICVVEYVVEYKDDRLLAEKRSID